MTFVSHKAHKKPTNIEDQYVTQLIVLVEININQFGLGITKIILVELQTFVIYTL